MCVEMIRVFKSTQSLLMIVSLLHLLTLYVFIHLPACVLHTLVNDVTSILRPVMY